MIVALIVAGLLGMTPQSPNPVGGSPYQWASDVFTIQWVDPVTKKPVEPPGDIKRYRVRCGQVAGTYTRARTLVPQQLVVGFRLLVDQPTQPTTWYCRVETTHTDGTTGPMSPEVSVVVQ